MPKSKYTRRSDGRLVTKITVCGHPKYIYGKTDQEIDEKILEIRNEEKQGLIVGDKTTLCEWIVNWYKTCRAVSGSYNTKQTYRNAINTHIIPALGNFPIRDIKPIQIQQLINSLSDKSNSLQRKVLSSLNQCFEYAIANGLLVKNPAKGIILTGKNPEEKMALSEDQQNILLEKVAGTRAETFVYIGLFCGLRREETLALTWDDVDLNKRIIDVNKAVYFEVNQPKLKPPKSKAGYRQVPIPPPLYNYLIQKQKFSNSDFVIPSAKGGMMSKSAYKRMWSIVIDLLQERPIKGLTPQEKRENMIFDVTSHLLRHTYCTNLYNAEIDLLLAKKLMGHSDAGITEKIYTHLNHQHVMLAQDKLDKFYDSCQKGCQNEV